MGKTSAEAKNRWSRKAYDALRIVVPKGRKADIEAYAAANGKSVNGLINEYLRNALGMTEAQWKQREE